MTRAWFRRRLDTDPRRWVLLLAALEGLSAFAFKVADRDDLLKPGPAIAIWFAFAVTTPAAGVLGMLAHGRLLWWTGKLLGGRARPEEIHAAFAWSELPFVVAAGPLVVAVPIRAAALQLDPRPPSLQVASDLLGAATGVCMAIASVTALAGAFLYVRFLGEAQHFRPGRAIANHLLALIAAVALLGAGVAAGAWLVPGAIGLIQALTGFATSATLALSVEVVVRISSRRARREARPSPGAV